MENLKKLIIQENKTRRRNAIKEANKINFSNTKDIEFAYLREFLPKAKQRNYDFGSSTALRFYLKRRIDKHFEQREAENLLMLDFNNIPKMDNEITITVEWKKNRTWGANPTAETFVSGLGWLSSGSIGGCGYCKRSTAVASVLNQIPALKMMMCQEKNKRNKFKKKNHVIFGYGSGYGIVPNFEGGVGVDCYKPILSKIGYNFETITSSKNVEVYRLTKI